MLSDNPNVSLKTVDCSLFTIRVLVAEPNHQYLQCNLEREPAQHNYMETIARIFIIPSRQNQFIPEINFKKASIGRLAVAMKANSAVAGYFHEHHQLDNAHRNFCEKFRHFYAKSKKNSFGFSYSHHQTQT